MRFRGSFGRVRIIGLIRLGRSVSKMGLDEYKELILTSLADGIPGFILLSERDPTNMQRLPVVLLEFASRESMNTCARLVYLNEDSVGVNVTYGLASPRHEELRDLIDLSLGTFELLDLSSSAAPPESVVEALITTFIRITFMRSHTQRAGNRGARRSITIRNCRSRR